MKKIICLVILLTVAFVLSLYATNSIYIELNELFAIIGFIILISIIINIYLSNKKKALVLRNSLMISCVLAILTIYLDIAIDHYFATPRQNDGGILTIRQTIAEFSDDLLIIVPIIVIVSAIVSFAGTMIISKVCKQKL